VWNPRPSIADLGLCTSAWGMLRPTFKARTEWRQSIFRIGRCGRPIYRNPVWHFQEVHHDIWDYDSAQPAVLFPLEKEEKHFRALGHCAKTGQYSFSTAYG